MILELIVDENENSVQILKAVIFSGVNLIQSRGQGTAIHTYTTC